MNREQRTKELKRKIRNKVFGYLEPVQSLAKNKKLHHRDTIGSPIWDKQGFILRLHNPWNQHGYKSGQPWLDVTLLNAGGTNRFIRVLGKTIWQDNKARGRIL